MHHETHEEANEPLIAREATDTTELAISEQEADRARTYEPRTTKSSHQSLWLLSLSAGISGLLFGYDTGVISSILVSLGDSLSRPTTTWDKSLIASSTSFLALLISPVSGYAADVLGRRPVIALASILFMIGALTQALATRVWVMVVGRSVVGAAVGAASCIVPLYIAEIAPAAARGRLVTVQSLFITGGQVVAYVVGWAVQGQWRIAVGAGALPAVLQLVLLWRMPESPRLLLMKGRVGEAREVLLRLGQEQDVENVLRMVQKEIDLEGAIKGKDKGFWRASYDDLICVPGHRRALTIACMLQAFQQLCGFNSLMYFSATIFAMVGFTSPIGTSLSVAGTNFLFTVIAFILIDTIGRRRILLLSTPFMVLGLALCAVVFVFIHPAPMSALSSTTPTSASAHPSTTLFPLALLASLILYVAAYAVGLGVVPWQQSELFPLSVRSLGSGLATATNWSSNFLIGISFLPMMDVAGPSVTFACYAGICALGWVGVWRFYPETKGLALEEVGALLAEGWGVRSGDKRRSSGVEGSSGLH